MLQVMLNQEESRINLYILPSGIVRISDFQFNQKPYLTFDGLIDFFTPTVRDWRQVSPPGYQRTFHLLHLTTFLRYSR